MAHERTIVFTWQAPSFSYREKKVDWYWWVGVIAAAGMGLTIWWHNYLFTAFIFIVALILIINGRRKPTMIPVELSELGIKINDRFFPYEELNGFWITNIREDQPHLHLHAGDKWLNYDLIEIDEQTVDPLDIRDFLLDFLPEYEIGESIGRRLVYKLRI